MVPQLLSEVIFDGGNRLRQVNNKSYIPQSDYAVEIIVIITVHVITLLFWCMQRKI